MGLRQWITEFKVPGAATPATTATDKVGEGQLSQQSQPSHGFERSQTRTGKAQMSQLSQALEVSPTDEAYEERAAIMEYDGGFTRAEAEYLAAQPPWRGEGLDLGDLRPCLWCRNLTRSGRCLAAWRGELRAARDYEPPIPGKTHRCIGYVPPPDDPDQRPGHERWPNFVESQTRLKE